MTVKRYLIADKVLVSILGGDFSMFKVITAVWHVVSFNWSHFGPVCILCSISIKTYPALVVVALSC